MVRKFRGTSTDALLITCNPDNTASNTMINYKPADPGYTLITTEPDETQMLTPSPDVPREYEEINTRLIRITRPFRTKWDLLLMVMAVYACFTVPLVAAFNEKETVTLFAVNTIIDFIFLGDIAMNFFTTFINSNGDEVTDLREISKHYLRTYFIVDFCGSFPIDNFYGRYADDKEVGEILNLSDLLKLVRILRLGRIIRFMRAKDEAKALIKLGQVTLYLLIWIHLTCCLYYSVATRNGDWIPVPDFVTGTTDLYESSLLRKYVTAYYHGMWLLKGNEVGPRDTETAMLGAILIILGSLITAILFGEMAVLMSNLNRRSTHFQSILDSTLTTMGNMKLPKPLANKILDYITATQHSLSAQEEYETFQKYISPGLQRQVSVCIFEPVVKCNEILRKEPKVADFIVQKLQSLFTKPEEDIITQGSEADALFYIASGELKVFVTNKDQDRTFVCYLGKGANFGEIALVYQTPRTATVESIGYSNIARLAKKDYDTMVSRYPHIVERFRSATTQYDDPWKTFILEILYQADYFEGLSPDMFQELMYLMKVRKFDSGSYIFRPGDHIEDILIIAEGRCELSLTINERHLHMLKKQHDPKNIEESPKIPRTCKDLEDFNSFNFPMNVLGNLKPRAEIIPVENSKGIAGAIMSGEKPPEQTTRIGDYPQEIVIDRLEKGSMLCHNLVLMDDFQALQLKATKSTTVYCLNISVLTNLAREHSEFASAMRAHKSRLVKPDNSKVYSPLDYLKFHESVNECRYQWKANIIKVIRDNRENRLKGSNQILKLVPKINAILSCEAAGNFDLAQRIVRDEIPPHYITEDGCLDKAAISSNDPSIMPNSHPVLQLFKKICNDALEPDGHIISQYAALEHIVMHQNSQLNLFRRELLGLKAKLGHFVGVEAKLAVPKSGNVSRLPSINKEIDMEMLKLDIDAVTNATHERRKIRKDYQIREPQDQTENPNLLDIVRNAK